MNESLTRRISWGAKQTSSAAVVSPTKKAPEEVSSDSEEIAPQSGKVESPTAAGGNAEANGKRRRAATFDFVGTGTDAENYEDQFKQAYHDETDMEDAFATDDAKDHVMDDSDAETAPASKAAAEKARSSKASVENDAKSTQAQEDPDAPPPTLSEAMKATSGTSPSDEAPIASESAAAEDQSANVAVETDVNATPSKSGKKPSKKKSKTNVKKGKGKSVKPMEALPEEGEDSDSHSVSSSQQPPASSSPAIASPTPDTPNRKKSSFMGFLKRLGGGSKPHKHADEGHSSEHEPDASGVVAAPSTSTSASAAATASPSAGASAASPSGVPVSASPSKDTSAQGVDAPKTPRGAKAPKVDPYEAMKAELRSYAEMERAFIQDLHTLLDEYLLPAKKLAVPIEHVSVLCAPVEQMIASHSETLKIVEKKAKDDQYPIGTTFDDLLAAVSDSYKLYRSKQVLLLSLLDSSPTEKSMADHAAISNWLETRYEEHQEQIANAKHVKQIPPLQELVLEPMHRLAGIAFLLEQLSVVTPQTHPDFPNIRKATARVHLLQQELSMRGTTYRSMTKLSEIDAMLEFPYGVPSFQLADEASKRSYLLEGPVYQVEQHSDHSEFSKVYFFLFSDMLLICKQLARDTAPNSTKQGRRNAASRQNSIARQSSGVHSPSGQILHSPANKYIVLSRLSLDHLFLVDPDDSGEMASFGLKRREREPEESSAPGASTTTTATATATTTTKNSDAESSPPPQKGRQSSPPRSPMTPRTKSRSESASKTPNKNADVESDANANDDIEELKEVDRLLEIVDMGVAIHRLRFSSRDDKKLWIATFNSAFSNVKLSFGVNERQYLYKLLMATQVCKPILGSDPDSDSLAAWPSARFVASSATRQLIDRLHSHAPFASVNLHKSPSLNVDSDVALIKQEVANLKREHLRQLAELSAQHEKDQAEIGELQKEVKAKDEMISTQTRQTRSDTMDSVDSSTSASSAKKKKKGAVLDETVLQKYVARLEARENDMVKRMDVAESLMKLQSEHFLKTVHTMTKEMEEMKNERKAMMQQQDRLAAALDRLMNTSPASFGTNGGLQRESSSERPAPGIVAAARESVIRQSSGVSSNKPAVPAKPTPTIVAPSAVKLGAGGAPPRGVPGGWRGSAGSPSLASASAAAAAANNNSVVNSASSSTISSPAPTDKAMNPTIAAFGSKGKRPSSVSLIAAVPLEQVPPSDSVADSSESSGPRTGSTTGANSFGTAGKSPSRLNLSAAQGAAAATDKPVPVSPGGRGKERKVKNLRYPNGENEGGKSGNWLQKKLGLSSKDKPRRDEVAGQPSTSWRQTPSAPGNSSDAPITVKKANKVDWSQAKAEAYLSDDLGSDYDPAMAMSPSDFERNQEEFMAPDAIGSDYSDEGEGH